MRDSETLCVKISLYLADPCPRVEGKRPLLKRAPTVKDERSSQAGHISRKPSRATSLLENRQSKMRISKGNHSSHRSMRDHGSKEDGHSGCSRVPCWSSSWKQEPPTGSTTNASLFLQVDKEKGPEVRCSIPLLISRDLGFPDRMKEEI